MREPHPTVEVGDADHGVPLAVAENVVAGERNNERRDASLAQRCDERAQNSVLPLSGDVKRLEQGNALAAVVHLRRHWCFPGRSAPLHQQVPRPDRLRVISAQKFGEAGRSLGA